jgi:hypothetical protein
MGAGRGGGKSEIFFPLMLREDQKLNKKEVLGKTNRFFPLIRQELHKNRNN